jgi:hypothetical protein
MDQDFSDVAAMLGGITAWLALGFPVEGEDI